MGNFLLNIEDFQSISKAKLEFVPGINLILGQSNSGKTAVLRAISAALQNPTFAKSFVKHKSNKAEVSFEYEGNRVAWQKQAKGGTLYGVNGEEYTKVGTSDLFDLLPNNGFVRSYDDEVMNIEGEWDLPFPFDRTPAELFRLFENVFCVSDSTTILKTFKEEETELVRQTSSIKDKITLNTNKYKALKELAEEADLTKFKKKLVSFEEQSDNYFNTQADYDSVVKSAKLVNFNINEVLPPESNTLPELLTTNTDYNFLTNVASKIKFYKTLPSIMEVPETLAQYQAIFNDLVIIESGMLANNFMVDKKIEITGDTLQSYFNLKDDLEVIENGMKASNFELKGTCKEDYSLSLTAYTDMLEDLTDIIAKARRCKALKLQYESVTSRINELEAKLSEYKVCPLCGHELEGEHALC